MRFIGAQKYQFGRVCITVGKSWLVDTGLCVILDPCLSELGNLIPEKHWRTRAIGQASHVPNHTKWFGMSLELGTFGLAVIAK